MGCSESREDIHDIDFTQDQINRMRELFHTQINKNPKTKGNSEMDKYAFSELFPENLKFGRKLHKFIQLFLRKDKFTFKTFLRGAEVLIKDPNSKSHPLQIIGNLNKVDMFFMASNLQILRDYEQNNTDPRKILIGYSQALVFLTNVLKIFNYDSTYSKIQEEAARSLVDTIFRDEFGQIDYWTFMHMVKEQLFYLNNVLKYYFEAKFIRQSVQFHLPQLDSNSLLLNKEYLSLIYLSNTYMQASHDMKLLYSSNKDNFDFDQLSRSLLEFQGSTFLIIEAKESSEGEEGEEGISYGEKKKWVYGAFNTQWSNSASYQGSQETYVFSLYPKFQNYFPAADKGHHHHQTKNYAYLYNPVVNDGKQQFNQAGNVGLGFGGSNDRYRLWIDREIREKSYTSHIDSTFRQGYLQDPKLQSTISNIEVWGVVKTAGRKSALGRASAINARTSAIGGGAVSTSQIRITSNNIIDQTPEYKIASEQLVDPHYANTGTYQKVTHLQNTSSKYETADAYLASIGHEVKDHHHSPITTTTTKVAEPIVVKSIIQEPIVHHHHDSETFETKKHYSHIPTAHVHTETRVVREPHHHVDVETIETRKHQSHIPIRSSSNNYVVRSTSPHQIVTPGSGHHHHEVRSVTPLAHVHQSPIVTSNIRESQGSPYQHQQSSYIRQN